MSDYVRTTFYVQVLPEWRQNRNWEDAVLAGIKAGRITLTKPKRPEPNSVTVKLTVELPRAAFLPLAPEAVVRVPAEFIVANDVVHVEAEQPEDMA